MAQIQQGHMQRLTDASQAEIVLRAIDTKLAVQGKAAIGALLTGASTYNAKA